MDFAEQAIAAAQSFRADESDVLNLLVVQLDREDEADGPAEDQSVFRHEPKAGRPRAYNATFAKEIDTGDGTPASHRYCQASTDGDADLPSGPQLGVGVGQRDCYLAGRRYCGHHPDRPASGNRIHLSIAELYRFRRRSRRQPQTESQYCK